MQYTYFRMFNTRLSMSAVALSLTLAGSAAMAQSGTSSKSLCISTGAAAMEPVGDREGHTLQNSLGTCRVEGAAFDGAVVTVYATWEQDKMTGTLLSGDGILRKPGALAAYRQLTGQRSLVVQDGKVVGWTATGKSVFTLAAGTFSAYAGKTFSWTAKSTAPNQFVIDSTID